MAPFRYQREWTVAVEVLKQVVGSLEGARLVEERDGYLRYEFTSRWLRFVDDVEFVFDEAGKIIHFRSASRVGYSDLGVNRRRMESIRSQVEGRL